MNIPPYWSKAKANAEVSRNRGWKLDLSAWGWSNRDQADADNQARQRLASLVARVEAGEDLPRGYGYGNRPLREEIDEKLAAGEGAAFVTRNAYGCLVLNTEAVLFLDIDIPQQSMSTVDRLRRLFGKAKPAPEAQVLANLRALLQRADGASFRVYRTAAGFRVLGTDRTYPQGDQAVAKLLADPVVDRAYAKLCQVQQSYRARLTPKPWRCGCDRPQARFPFTTAAERASFNKWLAKYERASAGKATCVLAEEVGLGRVSPKIAPILEFHDRATRIDAGLPLA